MGPTVTLEFQGEGGDLISEAKKVGNAMEDMSNDVGKSTKDIRSHAKAFDVMGEGTDKAEKKFTGFKDVLDGGSSALATFSDSSLSTTDKLIAFGQAGADMAGGLTDFLIPAISSMATLLRGGLANAMTFIAAHPMMIALILLAAIFVLLWTRSETFREIVLGVFKAVGDFIMTVFKSAFDFVVGLIQGYINIYITLGRGIVAAFEAVGEGIKHAFRAAFNFVADVWNNTVGRLDFSIPDWVPIIGGKHFGVPHISRMHTGGIVSGPPGSEQLRILKAGERISSTEDTNRAANNGGELRVTGDAKSFLYQMIKYGVRTGQLKLG